MPAKPFQASTRHQPDAEIIDLRGEINAAAEAGLSAAYTEAEGRNPPTIVLNVPAKPSAACSSSASARTTRRSSRSPAWPIS